MRHRYPHIRRLHEELNKDVAALGPSFFALLEYIDTDAGEAAQFGGEFDKRYPGPNPLAPIPEQVEALAKRDEALWDAAGLIRRLHMEIAAKLESPNHHAVAGNLSEEKDGVGASGTGISSHPSKTWQGMSYIAHLLARPGMEVPVSDLRQSDIRRRVGAGDKVYSTMSKEVRGEMVLEKEGLGGGVNDLGPISDREALQVYKERLDELERELKTAREP